MGPLVGGVNVAVLFMGPVVGGTAEEAVVTVDTFPLLLISMGTVGVLNLGTFLTERGSDWSPITHYWLNWIF